MSESRVKFLRKSFRKRYRTLSKQVPLKQPDTICNLIYHTNIALTTPITTTPTLNLPQLGGIEGLSYYHGLITEAEGVALMQNEGDFLIRNSSSAPKVLLLSCLHFATPFSFQIFLIEVKNKHHDVTERYYQLENSTEKYSKMAELINHYKYEHKSLSRTQTIIISTPVKCTNRNLMPLANHNALSITSLGGIGGKVGQKWAGSQPLLNAPMNPDLDNIAFLPSRYDSMPSIHKRMKGLKDPLTQLLVNSITTSVAVTGIKVAGGYDNDNNGGDDKDNNGGDDKDNNGGDDNDNNGGNDNGGTKDGDDKVDNEAADSNVNTCSINNNIINNNNNNNNADNRNNKNLKDANNNTIASIGNTTSRSNNTTNTGPPPKPSRVPTVRINEGQTKRPIVKKRTRKISEDEDDDGVEIKSFFSQSHSSKFVNPDQPLVEECTNEMTEIILSSTPLSIAKCLTLTDIKVFHLGGVNHCKVGGVSGMELMVLPEGGVVRGDALERHNVLRYFVIATLLSNQPTNQEDKRHALLSHWLDVAMQLKKWTGNLFSFFTVLDAVCSPQIIRLKSTWLKFKQEHSCNFETFESDLLPSYKGLLDLSSLSDPYKRGTILPHLLPFLLDLEGSEKENSGPGLDGMMTSFAATRLVLSNIRLYRKAVEAFNKNNNDNNNNGNGNNKNNNTKHNNNNIDDKLENLKDVLNPNTQGVFLWGPEWRGMHRDGRVGKMDELLSSKSCMLE